MESTTQYNETIEEISGDRNFSFDTSFVLFFLAIEFGQSFSGFGFEGVFLLITLAAVAVLPYFIAAGEIPEFRNWVIGRAAIAVFAVVLGIAFKQSLGVVLPEEFRFVPMTLLIISALLSCFIQFDQFFRFRLAK